MQFWKYVQRDFSELMFDGAQKRNSEGAEIHQVSTTRTITNGYNWIGIAKFKLEYPGQLERTRKEMRL